MGILKKPVLGYRRYGVSIPCFLTSNESVIVPRERSESFCKGVRLWRTPEEGGVVELPPCRMGPAQDCTCGFYAFNSMEKFFQDGSYVNDGMIAEVYMWGRVHVYKKGYRAQYTYPKRMWAYGTMAMSVRLRMQSEYGVPIGILNEDWGSLLGAHINRKYDERERGRPLTEKELWIRVAMGDDLATKTLRARLSSAICGRRKSIVRVTEDLARLKQELVTKTEQRLSLKRVK